MVYQNNLIDDIHNILNDLKIINSNIIIDKEYINNNIDYIRNILINIYDSNTVKKYLYDEILIQIIYQYYSELAQDSPYIFIRNNDIIENNTKRVLELDKIPQMEQRSDEWFLYRTNRITASDFSSIFGKNIFKSKKQLLSEKINPKNCKYVTNDTILHGIRLEEVISQIYCKKEGVTVKEYGCLKHDTINYLGASPDGITTDGIMLEIKCPSKRIIKGIPPIYYWYQIQLQLEVADLNQCDYVECKIDIIDYTIFADIIKKDKYNLEAGCFIECWDSNTNKLVHHYYKVGNDLSKIKEWETNYIDNLEEHLEYRNSLYWKLNTYSKLTIFRNRQWFQDQLPIIKEFWDSVINGRESSSNTLDPVLKKTYKKKKIVCLIQSNSDSE